MYSFLPGAQVYGFGTPSSQSLQHAHFAAFRATNLASDKSEHFTEALNISRGGFFFASSAPLQVGMPIDCTLRMPAEVTGSRSQETHCTARVVHVRNEPYGDGRIGFGAEIEEIPHPAIGGLPKTQHLGSSSEIHGTI